MIGRVLDIPDEEPATAAWLDEQIVSADLHEFVAELATVHDVPLPGSIASPAAAAAWLGDALPDLLARGTAALDRSQFAALLRTPGLLPAIQELVFVEGGEHWVEAMARAAPPAAASGDGLTTGGGATTGDGIAPEVWPAAAPGVGVRPSLLPAAVAAVAASLLFALATWSILQPGPAAPWGWNRPAVLAAATAPEYLDSLAAAAGEWSAEVPKTETALARRLGELLAGCDRLIAASHEPLAAADRAWLVERCGAWREKIAGHLAALEANHDVAAVRGAADATVAKLTTALRARAEEIRGREAAA